MRRTTLRQLLMAGDACQYARAALDTRSDRYLELLGEYPEALRDEHRELLHAGFQEITATRSGEVYVCSHPAWPGLVKIGCSRKDAEARVAQLSGAGMLGAHQLHSRWWHFDAHRLEALIHRKLGLVRYPQSEWFATTPERAAAVIEATRDQDSRWAVELLSL